MQRRWPSRNHPADGLWRSCRPPSAISAIWNEISEEYMQLKTSALGPPVVGLLPSGARTHCTDEERGNAESTGCLPISFPCMLA